MNYRSGYSNLRCYPVRPRPTPVVTLHPAPAVHAWIADDPVVRFPRPSFPSPWLRPGTIEPARIFLLGAYES